MDRTEEPGTISDQGPGNADRLSLQQEVSRRVAEGRRRGIYSDSLDEELASGFARMGRDPLWFDSFGQMEAALREIRSTRFALDPPSSSNFPAGAQLHRVVGRVIGQQVTGVMNQVRMLAGLSVGALNALERSLTELRLVISEDVLGDLDDLHHRLVAIERRLNLLESADRGVDS